MSPPEGWDGREPRGQPRELRGDGRRESPRSGEGRRAALAERPGGGSRAGKGPGAPAARGRSPTCAAAVPGDHGLSGERVQPGRALRLLAAGRDTQTKSGGRSPSAPAAAFPPARPSRPPARPSQPHSPAGRPPAHLMKKTRPPWLIP